MPNKTIPHNPNANFSPEALSRVANHNIVLPDDEKISKGNFSVRVFNDYVHSDIYMMQMLSNIFKTNAKKAASVTLSIHANGSATMFTGSRENCRHLIRLIEAHGGCMATNLVLGINNNSPLKTEMLRNSDDSKNNAIVSFY